VSISPQGYLIFVRLFGFMSQWTVVIFSRGSAIDAHQLTSGACVVEMPFQKFASFFSSEELDAMTAAYNETWPRLTQTTPIPAHQFSEVKAKLEHVILAAACTGKRDKELLEDAVLRALAPRF
jgi:hypothetical protein